jgi:hypothetical protein
MPRDGNTARLRACLDELWHEVCAGRYRNAMHLSGRVDRLLRDIERDEMVSESYAKDIADSLARAQATCDVFDAVLGAGAGS